MELGLVRGTLSMKFLFLLAVVLIEQRSCLILRAPLLTAKSGKLTLPERRTKECVTIARRFIHGPKQIGVVARLASDFCESVHGRGSEKCNRFAEVLNYAVEGHSHQVSITAENFCAFTEERIADMEGAARMPKMGHGGLSDFSTSTECTAMMTRQMKTLESPLRQNGVANFMFDTCVGQHCGQRLPSRTRNCTVDSPPTHSTWACTSARDYFAEHAQEFGETVGANEICGMFSDFIADLALLVNSYESVMVPSFVDRWKLPHFAASHDTETSWDGTQPPSDSSARTGASGTAKIVTEDIGALASNSPRASRHSPSLTMKGCQRVVRRFLHGPKEVRALTDLAIDYCTKHESDQNRVRFCPHFKDAVESALKEEPEGSALDADGLCLLMERRNLESSGAARVPNAGFGTLVNFTAGADCAAAVGNKIKPRIMVEGDDAASIWYHVCMNQECAHRLPSRTRNCTMDHPPTHSAWICEEAHEYMFGRLKDSKKRLDVKDICGLYADFVRNLGVDMEAYRHVVHKDFAVQAWAPMPPSDTRGLLSAQLINDAAMRDLRDGVGDHATMESFSSECFRVQWHSGLVVLPLTVAVLSILAMP